MRLMQIDPNTNPAPLGKTGAARRAAPAPKTEDQTHFLASDSVNRLLAETPDVRAAEVARANVLVDTATYPPPELIKRLARLLAQDLPNQDQ